MDRGCNVSLVCSGFVWGVHMECVFGVRVLVGFGECQSTVQRSSLFRISTRAGVGGGSPPLPLPKKATDVACRKDEKCYRAPRRARAGGREGRGAVCLA